MPSEREILYEKLYRFYERHDPGRLKHGIDAVVDFGLAEGLSALNSGLMDRYGDYLDSGSDHAFNGGGDRDIIRSRIEMFYLKHDPSKLDNIGDMDAIVEWAMYNGLDMLSEKVGRKYGEGIEDVQEEEILVQLESFYAKHDKNKSSDDIRTVLTWGIVNGFTLLNRKMIEKYGEGLGSTDRAKLRKEIEQKLIAFYTVQDKSKLDPENLEFIVDYALKHGLGNLNTRLQAKYGCNMNTINRPTRGTIASSRGSSRTSIRQSVRKSLSNFHRKSQSVSVEEAEAAVRADVEYQEYLRKLVEVFYARHDANRLLEEGVSPIIEFAISHGEEALNQKLRKKYNEDLVDIDREFQHVREKLVRFYEKYDPSKLEDNKEKDLDTIIGWALVHGVDKLNATLMKKYDEDIDGNGLRVRLKLFYEEFDSKTKKSQKELDDIIAWVFANSVDALNKKLKKKYGRSLEDTTFAESDIPPPPPEEDLPPMPPPKPSSSSKYQRKAPLPPGPIPDEDVSQIPDESQRENTQTALEHKLLKFYQKKDPRKANPDQIGDDVTAILQNGVDAFNAKLMKQYGESLNSMRPKSLMKKRAESSRQRKIVTDKV